MCSDTSLTTTTCMHLDIYLVLPFRLEEGVTISDHAEVQLPFLSCRSSRFRSCVCQAHLPAHTHRKAWGSGRLCVTFQWRWG